MKNSITDIKHDPLIPFEHQEIEMSHLSKICEEFGQAGCKDDYVIGYNPKHPICLSCSMQGYCMRLGRELTIEDRLSVVKEELSIKSFYGEHKVFALTQSMFDLYTNLIKTQTEKGELIDLDKLTAKVKEVFLEEMNVASEQLPLDFITRIINHDNVQINDDNKLEWI